RRRSDAARAPDVLVVYARARLISVADRQGVGRLNGPAGLDINPLNPQSRCWCRPRRTIQWVFSHPHTSMRICRVFTLLACVAVLVGYGRNVHAQEPSRAGEIEQEQAEKTKTLHPYPVSTGERIMNKVEDITVNGGLHWHPFFDSAYHGAGFTLGAGYMHPVSSYNVVDVRGSYSILNYKRVEAEFMAPRMFNRRGELSVLGGFREAPQVAFYGTGIDSIKDDRTNYLFNERYGSAVMTLWPTRRFLLLRG